MERIYYEIDEESARIAKSMCSFDEYEAGSLTRDYREAADRAYDLAEEIANAKPGRAGDAEYLAKRYAKKLADNLNEDSRIGTRCPSVLIAGPANFPVKKKEKQVAAWERNMQERQKINGIITRMNKILDGKEVIRSDDPMAIDKLQDKLDDLTQLQEHMKAVNAYYRKNETIDDCPECTEKEVATLKEAMAQSWHGPKPYESWRLSNNNQNMNNIKKRIARLTAEAEREAEDIETDYFKVIENKELMRLQLIFDNKPDEDIRNLLKSNGFRWAPSQGAWQRQLNENSRAALRRILKSMKEKEGR